MVNYIVARQLVQTMNYRLSEYATTVFYFNWYISNSLILVVIYSDLGNKVIVLLF